MGKRRRIYSPFFLAFVVSSCVDCSTKSQVKASSLFYAVVSRESGLTGWAGLSQRKVTCVPDATVGFGTIMATSKAPDRIVCTPKRLPESNWFSGHRVLAG